MTRRQVTVNEIVEMVYQSYQGGTVKGIQRSSGFDRKTIRKYVAMAQRVGVHREESFPQEPDLVERLKVFERFGPSSAEARAGIDWSSPAFDRKVA